MTRQGHTQLAPDKKAHVAVNPLMKDALLAAFLDRPFSLQSLARTTRLIYTSIEQCCASRPGT
jgi:hypothetical protein